jgi:hypothetical protein
MNDWSRLFPSVPAFLALAGAGFELAWLAARWRGRLRSSPPMVFAAWALRPWTLWALFNLFYRWRWDQGFNARRTFPFYALPWQPEETFAEAWTRIAHAPGLPWLGAALLLLAALIGLLVWVVRRNPGRLWPALGGLYLLAIGLHLSLACLPDGARDEPGRPGSLRAAWNNPGSTMLYAQPLIQNSRDYFCRFQELQPKLRRTIHGLSHPPGASLALRWIGQAAGVKSRDIRNPENRLRYTVGLVAFGALNVFAIFALGRALFDARAGFLAATLWAAAPAVAAYAPFAQDATYAVFFNLALWLGWQTAVAERRRGVWGFLLGLDFFVLILMNYSWVLATSLFALFALATGLRNRWALREYGARLVWPLAVMTVVAGAFLAAHRLDYWAIYHYASQYVKQWYPFTGPYQWTMALLGGQIDLWLMLGSVTCSAFVAALAGLRRADFAAPRTIYLFIVFGIFALPLLFGPNCLKMEAARCWIWVASLPLAFAADRLLRAPRLLLYGAPAVSALTYAGLRLFLDFAA